MESEPVSLSIIFSETVIRDQISGKLSLIGIFTHYVLRNFPANVAPFWVTAMITNVLGPEPLAVTIRIEHAESGHVAASEPVNVPTAKPGGSKADKDSVFEIPVHFKQCSFAKAGKYNVVVLVDNSIVSSRVLPVYNG